MDPWTGARTLEVLVVDDGPLNRDLNRALLESLGCRVTTASNGAEAVAMAVSTMFDAVFMDLHMPGLDGRAASQRIRVAESEMGRIATPIVGVTADDGLAVDADWCAFLLDKPVTAEALRGALFNVTGHAIASDVPASAPALPAGLADRFLTMVTSNVSRLRGALERGDFAVIAQMGHSLKGLGSTFGYPEISELGARIERDAKQQAGERIGQWIDELAIRVSE